MSVSLAQIVAALSVTYEDDGVLIWLTSKNGGLLSRPDGSWSCSPQEFLASGLIGEVADAVRRIGDADPADFVVIEKAQTRAAPTDAWPRRP